MRNLLLAFLFAVHVPTAQAETLKVIGAGSLTAAFSDLLRRFPAGPDTVAPPEFGPSGLMRAKIEAGTPADLFASADMEQARRLAIGHPERSVIHFTRNRLCAFARAKTALTPDNLLDKLLDPALRLATSTPNADPAGDYAWAVFARAEALRPGAQATLQAKAQQLVGGGDKTPLLVPGKGAAEGVFLADKADIMLGYCSGAETMRHEIPDIAATALPPGLTVGPAYGMVILNPSPLTLRFATYVMSEPGQTILRAHGFDPTAYADPPQAAAPLLVQRAGRPPRFLTQADLAALKPVTQHLTIGMEPDAKASDFTGPLLWDVLAAAMDLGKPADHVRQTVRITGADGYTAVFALAELDPQFAARPIQLAITAALPRLIVPAEHRGGRSVRDVVRIDVE